MSSRYGRFREVLPVSPGDYPPKGRQSFAGNPQVHAGDLVSAWVAAPDESPKAGEWYFEVADLTIGKTWDEYCVGGG